MLPNLQCEEVSNGTHAKGKNCRVISSKHEGLPFQQKAGKVHRSVSSSSKRLRISEDSTDLKGIENSKESSDKHASNHIKCDSSEKSQVSKQKSNGSKRGDKKNIKVPSKAKFDSSSMKLGAAVFNSACGGNNFFGIILGILYFSTNDHKPPVSSLPSWLCPCLIISLVYMYYHVLSYNSVYNFTASPFQPV
ncbi:uncharacterized protein LOC129310413 [Prosopis cineraria]|uniref:uncharacterized protein LOC129310413 n=1 Tax=Prosopis cineraria TaxID=364024 RepID=UPI00240F040C|nr:uncharacterized protein LOC129310413 [Prosopis cineraria]